MTVYIKQMPWTEQQIWGSEAKPETLYAKHFSFVENRKQQR